MLTRRAFNTFLASIPLLGFASAKPETLGFYDAEKLVIERKIISVNIESTFQLEQVFEGGSLEVFENIEPIEYTITLEYDNGDIDEYVTIEVSCSNKSQWSRWSIITPCPIKKTPVSESCSGSTKRLYYDISEIKIDNNDIYMSIDSEIKEISNTTCIFKNCKMLAKPGQILMSEGCYKELKEWCKIGSVKVERREE